MPVKQLKRLQQVQSFYKRTRAAHRADFTQHQQTQLLGCSCSGRTVPAGVLSSLHSQQLHSLPLTQCVAEPQRTRRHSAARTHVQRVTLDALRTTGVYSWCCCSRLVGLDSSRALSRCALQSLAVNRRIQSQNKAPREFPLFVREGYKVKVLADDYIMDKGGLIYKACTGPGSAGILLLLSSGQYDSVCRTMTWAQGRSQRMGRK